ncbi:T9SS type A sorting domain-containing protein [Saccharicrinis sp. FJH54]|uniref:T9SS type A sorting domain-containing protein n=1 Tax=Saccharicrinis sp. FJH54 TaxID=3344665 RepID=UPI0035D4F8C8
MKTLILLLGFCLLAALLNAQNDSPSAMGALNKSAKSSESVRVDQRSFPDRYALQNSWLSPKMHKLDSVYTETVYETEDPFFEANTEREMYEYDSYGNVLTEKHHIWNGEEWKPRLEYVMTYNSAGLNLTETVRDWNEMDEKWFETAKTERSYDDGNRLISIVEYEEDGDVLKPYCKTEYFYDAGSIYPVYEIDYDWSGSWDENAKTESKWDDKGNLTEEISYDFQSADRTWIKDSKWVYEYDGKGNWVSETDYDWYDDWVFNWKCENIYNSNNQRIQYNSFGWNDEDSIWYKSFQYLYAFNENGNMTSMISSHWSDESEEFVPYDKNEYVYDDDFNMSSYSYSEYENSTGGWSVLFKSEYESAAGLSFLNIALPFETEFEYSGKFATAPQTETNYIEEDGTLVAYTRANFFYSEFSSTGVILNTGRDIMMYPNPAKDYVTLVSASDFGSVQVFGLNGIKLLEQEDDTGRKQRVLDISELESGIYLCRIKTGDVWISRKLIVR